MDAAKQYASYEDILNAPDNVQAEILNGELHTHPRPSPKHSRSITKLSAELSGPFDKGSGGPGGWIFLVEPELWLSSEAGSRGNYLVPDIAGWKRERFVHDESKNGIEVPPDWVCEVLSPGTMVHDRVRKMPIYSSFSIPFIWLVDPAAKLLEAFELSDSKWSLIGSFAGKDKVKALPFEAFEFDLAALWL
ncbi:MAG: Uma2 family endonuclease [Oligoflexus sp.]